MYVFSRHTGSVLVFRFSEDLGFSLLTPNPHLGRDWYDFVWYVAKKTALHLKHLEERMRQSGNWARQEPLTSESVLELLEKKIANLNIRAALDDIRVFVSDKRKIEIWSKEFFLSLLPQLQFI